MERLLQHAGGTQNDRCRSGIFMLSVSQCLFDICLFVDLCFHVSVPLTTDILRLGLTYR